MVSGDPLTKAFVVFKHRPVNYPEVVELVFVNQVQFLGDAFTQVTQGVADHVEGAGHEEDQVPYLGA